MAYELQAKPFEGKKEGVKYFIIRMNDFALHTSSKRPTSSLVNKIKDLFQGKKSIRFYGSFKNPENNDAFDINKIKNDPNLIKFIQEKEKEGYKVLIDIPKDVIPVIPGKDTEDFINSKNGQRIIRGLAKNEDKVV
jgi:hypothetical protein